MEDKLNIRVLLILAIFNVIVIFGCFIWLILLVGNYRHQVKQLSTSQSIGSRGSALPLTYAGKTYMVVCMDTIDYKRVDCPIPFVHGLEKLESKLLTMKK